MANTVAFYIEDTAVLLRDYDNSKHARESGVRQVLYIVSAPAGAR